MLSSLQITNEPNLSFMDGSKPYVLDALAHGVIAAKEEIRRQGLAIDVGFGSVPQSLVALPHFWENAAAKGGPALVDAVDFVGHNFYVDVFESPVEPGVQNVHGTGAGKASAIATRRARLSVQVEVLF